MTRQFKTFENEDAWRQARSGFIGASESPAIFGCGYANESPYSIWAEKTGKITREISPELEARFRLGKRMEQVIAAEFFEQSGFSEISIAPHTVYFHADHNWMGATLDRAVGHDDYGFCPLELKNLNEFQRAEWEGDEPPLQYNVQLQHQMAVSGAEYGFLAAIIGGQKLEWFGVPRNDRFIDVLIPRLAEFWRFVTDNIEPPIDASEATKMALKAVYPQDDGLEVSLPNAAVDWDEDLAAIKAQIKRLEADKTGLENKIIAELGTATFGRLPGGGSYKYKVEPRDGYTVGPSNPRILRRLKK